MRVNGVTNYSYRTKKHVNGVVNQNGNPKKQVSFGIIKDKTAEEIVEKNAKNSVTYPFLKSTPFFTVSSKDGKLNIKLEREVLKKKTHEIVYNAVLDDKDLDYSNPLKAIDIFGLCAYCLSDYDDNTETPLEPPIIALYDVNSVDTEPQLTDEEIAWNRVMNDLAF